jgi:competence protein CoiA
MIMPLKAIAGGETIIAPDLSDMEWEDLKLRHKKGLAVTMACCGAAGHLRTSKAGTRHFYHAADTGCHYEEESKEHLEIKNLIYRICKSEGWETFVEFPAPDRSWISDVVAQNDGRTVVFEVQISALALNELFERDRKYRNEGIESYWLLKNFLNSSKECASRYYALLNEDDDRSGENIPYIDDSVFDTGPENHLFITTGIRSVGLNAQHQTVFTTHKPELPLADWVRYVLNRNYPNYLENTASAFHHRRQLKSRAAPVLRRFRNFYEDVVRHETYQKKVNSVYRIVKSDPTLLNNKFLQKKFNEIFSEIEWMNTEYRNYTSESYGLFWWKISSKFQTPMPLFRLESEIKIEKLKECVKTLSHWEEFFTTALHEVEKEIQTFKRRRK